MQLEKCWNAGENPFQIAETKPLHFSSEKGEVRCFWLEVLELAETSDKT